MIAQILNRNFVLEQLSDIRARLEKSVEGERLGDLAEDEGPSRQDYEEALARLKKAEASEGRASSGQPGYEPSASVRRGGNETPLDDFSFFSRDPVVNILQSALEQYFEERGSTQEEQVIKAELPDDRRGASAEVAVTDLSLTAEQPPRRVEGRRIFNRFSITDPAWVCSVVAMGVRSLIFRHNFNPYPPPPLRVDNRARLILAGDWASGIPRARRVAEQMRRYVEEGRRENREVHVFHLGDVYYSGWEREYRKRFLPYWPVRVEEADAVGSWCLNGNHDMYSGGDAYYEYLLADPRFRRQEGASFFGLYNQYWQILSLDTAWEDGGLQDPQAEWLRDCIAGSERKVMLLSHHQPFSAYESGSEELMKKVRDCLRMKRVRAWFWGHEHRCVLYKETEGIAFPRCIGHGGVPVYMTHYENEPYLPPADYVYREYVKKGLEYWTLFGFAVLDFEGPYIKVRYVNEHGNTHKEETIV